MKNYPAFWLITSITTGTVLGLILDNVPAGSCLGASIGILSMLLSLPRIDQKKRH